MTHITCPRCNSPALLEPGFDEGSEEKIETTHRCAKCQQRFKWVPPTRSATPQKEFA